MKLTTRHLPRLPGVYAIINLVNGKMYIGSSKDIEHRLRKHLSLLRNNKHSQHLQNAWNLYGESNFEIRVLAVVEHEENLVTVEQKFLDDCRPFHCENGYNTSVLANKCVHTTESKQKLRTANLGKKQSLEARQKKKRFGEENHFFGKKHSLESKRKISKIHPFICIETGEIFHSYTEASERLNARAASISDCVTGKRNISNGYHFIRLDKLEMSIDSRTKKLNLSQNKQHELINTVDRKRKVFQCMTTGEFFTSVSHAARKLNIPRWGISDCLRNKIQQTYGYKFKYVG